MSKRKFLAVSPDCHEMLSALKLVERRPIADIVEDLVSSAVEERKKKRNDFFYNLRF